MRMMLMMLGVSALLVGCGDGGTKTPPAGKPAASADGKPAAVAAPALAKFVLKDEPAAARAVKAVKDAAKDGEEVVVVGRVQDFVEDRATFVLIDAALTPCNEKPGDACTTPWDYCCDTAKECAANSVAVKFLDAAGEVIKSPLAGTLRRLDRVTVTGKLSKAADGTLTLLAAGVFNKGGGVSP